MGMKCPHPVRLVGVRLTDHTPIERDIPCKRYSCEACAPGRRARVIRLIREGVKYGHQMRPNDPPRLVTLTYPIDTAADFHSRADMIDTSTRLRRVIQRLRRGGLEIQYGRLPESTKKGRIHVHMITWGDFVPKCTDRGRYSRGMATGKGSGSPCYCNPRRPCLQRAAWDEGFGWADVRKVRSVAQAASYVSKYLVKQSTIQQWPKYARRFSYSRQFAGGKTMGGMERSWWSHRLAEMSRLERAEWEARSAIWIGLARKKFLCEEARPLHHTRPPPVDGVLIASGEILPIPV